MTSSIITVERRRAKRRCMARVWKKRSRGLMASDGGWNPRWHRLRIVFPAAAKFSWRTFLIPPTELGMRNPPVCRLGKIRWLCWLPTTMCFAALRKHIRMRISWMSINCSSDTEFIACNFGGRISTATIRTIGFISTSKTRMSAVTMPSVGFFFWKWKRGKAVSNERFFCQNLDSRHGRIRPSSMPVLRPVVCRGD